MMMKTRLTLEGQIATITLCNPEKHNAFDDKVIAELREHLHTIRHTSGLRAMLLKAEGKHFCAGADLAWMKRMAQHSKAENLKDARQLASLMADLYQLPIPTVVAVQGAAYGGAIGLIACCDIAIAGESARFCLSEVKLGLAPATIAPYVVSAMGARRCNKLFLTAELFTSEQAMAFGLIHDKAPDSMLSEAIEKTLAQLLLAGPLASQAAKQLVHACKPPFDSNLAETTSQLIADLRVSEEGQEGLSAFFEKRSPSWIKT